MTFVDRLSEGSGGFVHYDFERAASPGWEAVDLRPLAWSAQERWFEALSLWHRALSDRASDRSRWWWGLPASRLNVFQPEPYRPLLFALALVAWARRFPGTALTVVACPPDVPAYVAELAATAVTVRLRSRARPWRRRHHRVREVAAVLRRALTGRSTRRIDPALAIVCSAPLSVHTTKDRGDHYYGTMLDKAQNDILWYYRGARASERESIRTALQARGRRVCFDTDVLTVAIAARALATALATRLALHRLEAPPLEIDGCRSALFPQRFLQTLATGHFAVEEIATYHTVRRLLARTGARAVTFPYEEKGVEHVTTMACRDHRPRPQVVGFAHAVYNRAHLYVRGAGGRHPAPDVLATTGPEATRWFRACGGVAARLVVVGSPRHADAMVSSAQRPHTPLRVLALLGYGWEAGVLADWIENDPELFDGCELIIRPYPFAWRATTDSARGPGAPHLDDRARAAA
jgi:hypothetical protein